MKTLVLFSLSLFLVSSCAYHTGTFSSSSPSSSVVYEDVAMGVVTTTNFLGIGGTSKDGLIYEAKKNLINNRPLQNNEEYLNFTVDYKRTNYLLVNTLKVTMTCDVVSRTSDTLKPIYSEKYKAKVLTPVQDSSFFSVGDTIIDQELKKGIIISILPNNKVIVLKKSANYIEKTKKYNLNSIFSTSRIKNGLKKGEYCSFTSISDEITQTGRVIGIGAKCILVLDRRGAYVMVDYLRVKKYKE